MNNALDIAKYTINYSIDINKPITHLKLQKILYYIQAACLVEMDQPAFCEEIINWTYGPVVPEVYISFKKYGYSDINQKILTSSELVIDPETLDVSFNDIEFTDDIIDTNTKQLVNKVIKAYDSVSAIKMMKKTHQEDPWRNTKNGDLIGVDIIREYYLEHKCKLYNL